MKAFASIAFALFASSLAVAARAQDAEASYGPAASRDAADVDDARAAPSRGPLRGLALQAGPRLTFIADDGFEAFSQRRSLAQLDLRASFPLLRAGRFSLAAVGGWSIGAVAGSMRGDDASLTVQRIVAGGEARVDLGHRLYLFGRVAPGVVHASASVTDAGAPRPLEGGGWSWAVDSTLGAALLMAGSGASTRLWLVADAGYAFAGAVPMHLAPPVETGDPRVFGSVAGPDVTAAGATATVSLAVSF